MRVKKSEDFEFIEDEMPSDMDEGFSEELDFLDD